MDNNCLCFILLLSIVSLKFFTVYQLIQFPDILLKIFNGNILIYKSICFFVIYVCQLCIFFSIVLLADLLYLMSTRYIFIMSIIFFTEHFYTHSIRHHSKHPAKLFICVFVLNKFNLIRATKKAIFKKKLHYIFSEYFE